MSFIPRVDLDFADIWSRANPHQQFELRSRDAGLTPYPDAQHERERNKEPTGYPSVIEPKCVDPCPLRLGLRVGNRNGITGRQSGNRLLGWIDDAMKAVARIPELKYRVDLLGVEPLESHHCTLCVDRLWRRALVAAVKHRTGENEDRGKHERQHQTHGIPPALNWPRREPWDDPNNRQHRHSKLRDSSDEKTRTAFGRIRHEECVG
jgi:hypothetical protein